ncbi:MAG: LacI family DNA-binding transcriptional regulator [Chloroflexota bacterium]
MRKFPQSVVYSSLSTPLANQADQFMIKKRVSIKDIAELAGVSHPTVSRALRGQGRMSDETRARIVAVADELGYTPSLMARGLVTQRSYCIGLIVPTFVNPFNSAVAQGIESEARQKGYSLFLASTDIEAQRELEVMRSFLGRQVDGIIVVSGHVGDEYAKVSIETGVPVVLINVNTPSSKAHAIYHDDVAGARKLVEYLLDQGRRRIAYLGASAEGRSHIERRKAWFETLLEAGLSTKLEGDGLSGTIDGGKLACTTLLNDSSSRPDAMVCFNDVMAVGAMSILRQEKVAIPIDVAVTGFDDIEMASVTEPPLTTIRQPLLDMGTEAMSLLLDLMDPETPAPESPVIKYMPGELIVRESA